LTEAEKFLFYMKICRVLKSKFLVQKNGFFVIYSILLFDKNVPLEHCISFLVVLCVMILLVFSLDLNSLY